MPLIVVLSIILLFLTFKYIKYETLNRNLQRINHLLWNSAIFLLMSVLGLTDVFWLRIFNIVFVFYGTNKTIRMKLADDNKNFVSNAVSTIKTSAVGIILSIIGLIVYSYIKGGDAYVESLSKTFLFGGNPTVMTYSICLFFEGMASSVMVAMFLLLY